ncbi:uncharacterized protein LOC141685763 [Apium graveolens]|uniref:uncharacterized protein LOC141685763 n=1 Tax=Apium graveolens TaxID=4045 RepID=UPI003D7A83C3
MDGLKRKAVDMNNPINKAFNMEVRAQLDGEIAQAFFLGAVNCEGELKDKFHITNFIKEVILEVGPQNVVQVITDNAPVCKAAGMIIETQYPHIFWTPCVVHTLNLALKNICAAKNIRGNQDVYHECHWITEVADSSLLIKNFILNHNMVLTMFNHIAPLRLLSVVETRFASVLVMLKRFKLLKRSLELLMLSEEMGFIILDDMWWDKVDYILEFTAPIYDMLRFADTDKYSLHLIYDMWDDMIENVKNIIYRHERKELNEDSTFHEVIYAILIDRWTKSSSPLHYLAHSLNSRYYNNTWLSAAVDRVPPHQDTELAEEMNKCLRRYFSNNEARTAVNTEFARFSGYMDIFGNPDSIEDREELEIAKLSLDEPEMEATMFKDD